MTELHFIGVDIGGTKCEPQIDALMQTLSLHDKVCQLTQTIPQYFRQQSQAVLTGVFEYLGLTEDDMNSIGSVLNAYLHGEMSEIQKMYLEKNKHHLPLIFMRDVIHGYRTLFPIPLAMGCTFDESIVELCAQMSANEARPDGVHITFSPMVDLVRDARWGRVMETTGEDPYLNGEMGKAFIRGYHKGGMGVCIKHFAGYGAAEAGKDYNTTEISEHQLKEYYLRAYQECMKEQPEMVMSSFNVLNGIPVNGNKELLIDVLRQEWGFDGVLISDYAAVREMKQHGYLETEKDCAQVAANNEIDIEMATATYIKYLPELIAEGRVAPETVNRMVRRVLQLKQKMGLLDNPYCGVDHEKAKEVAVSPKHREIARMAVEKSCVLLKNNQILPLNQNQKVAVVGPFAEEKDLSGFWWCYGNPEETITVKAGIETLLKREIPCARGGDSSLMTTDTSDIGQAVECAKNADVIIVCIGEPTGASGEGKSRADLRIPKIQRTLVEELHQLGIPIVAVVFGGRPQVLTEVEPLVEAILYAWQPGTEGGNGIANILYGKANPSAKTTMSFPRSSSQCPIYYNHLRTARPKPVDDMKQHDFTSCYIDELNSPLYPFGYGLSYTTFVLKDLVISAKTMGLGETLKLSVLVENTGDYDGEEVIQLYIRDHFASMIRPVKELKGFKKIFLRSGECQRVFFDIDESVLEFYTANVTCEVEEGSFTLMLGNSSVNVLQTDIVYCKETEG